VFKLIGVIAGFAIYSFIGGVLGLILGYFIDRLIGSTSIETEVDRQTLFLETLFIAMGKLSKADGHVSQDEFNHAELFMHKLGMSQDNCERAIALFKKGAASSFKIEPTCRKFMKACEQHEGLNQILLIYLIMMSLTDGDLHEKEKDTLASIANMLGCDHLSFPPLLKMIVQRSHFKGDVTVNEESLVAAYNALGLEKGAGQQSVSEAYHKLTEQYRPEQLLEQGVPEDMISMATEQVREIKLAYHYLNNHRC